jgi:hypothetical protein
MTKNFALVILVLEMAKMGEKPPRRTWHCHHGFKCYNTRKNIRMMDVAYRLNFKSNCNEKKLGQQTVVQCLGLEACTMQKKPQWQAFSLSLWF